MDRNTATVGSAAVVEFLDQRGMCWIGEDLQSGQPSFQFLQSVRGIVFSHQLTFSWRG